MTTRKQRFLQLGLACLIGLLFFLPDGARMWRLGSIRDYSPFSSRAYSMMTWDETFMYGAEVNYSYQHHRPAYDTDAYEHRNESVPYSVLPIDVEVALAEAMHSVAAAQIFCHFFFPALTAWLLIGVFRRLDASVWSGAFLALLTLIVSFAMDGFYISLRALVRFGARSPAFDTLAASRNPHPNMSFPLFLGAVLALAFALREKSRLHALAAGLLGGLLFYTYIYYAIPWSVAAALLVLACLACWRSRVPEALLSAAVTAMIGFPFLLWTKAAKKTGGYTYRSDRLGMIYSHLPSRTDLAYTAVFFLATALIAGAWIFYRGRLTGERAQMRRYTDSLILLFACSALGALAGINLELLTGFNVQAVKHYTHMVVQPALVIMVLVVLLAISRRLRSRSSAAWGGLLFAVLFLMAAVVQVVGALNSAEAHRILPADADLYRWLEHNSAPDDVVSTTNLDLCTMLPVMTHDYTLLVNGTRTSGSDEEVLDRFLLANALVKTPPAVVEQRLRPPVRPFQYPQDMALDRKYVPFLYEHSPYRVANLDRPALTASATAKALRKYRALLADPAALGHQLQRFRVNYIYAMPGESPIEIPGRRIEQVFKNGTGDNGNSGDTGQGTLWKIAP